MKITKEIKQGELVEWYYGYGYRNPYNFTIKVYIIPLNIFVQVGRFLYFKLRTRYFEPETEKFDIAYKQGFERGKEIGIQEGREIEMKKIHKLEKMLNDLIKP